MRTKWKLLKTYISSHEKPGGLYLSIIDEQGIIVNANAKMIQSLQLENPRKSRVDFIQLIHPVNQDKFRNVLSHCKEKGVPGSTEIYLKNGYYHPMKWSVVPFPDEASKTGQHYFCAGFQLAEEERLERSNKLGGQHYQHIIEGLNEGVLLQDINGEVISASQRTAEIFDTTLQRFYELKDIRHTWNSSWDVRNNEDGKLFFDDTPFMLAVATGKFCSGHTSVKLRSGEIRKIHFKSQPLFDEESKRVCAVLSCISDVTEEQTLSLRLRDKEELFNAFMNNTPNLAWVVDEDANLVVASRAFYNHFGIAENTAGGKKITELVPAEVCNALFEKHILALEKGDTVNLVEKLKWADGTTFIFHISIFPFQDTSGKRMLGGHAVNVEEKYAAEKQLRETNERLLLLSRASANSIWEWDMQTGYIFRNDALMDMIGYPQEETKGLSWWLRRIHPEDRNRVSDKVKEVTDIGKQSWEDEYRFKCADGSYKHMLDKGFVVYENGLPVRMIGSLQDVSDMKKLESELVEEKIRHQQEISETAIRVQEKERTRIGHELHDNVNQILSTTKLFVDLLTPGSEEEKLIKEKSVGYLLLAIEEIRKLSRELVTPELQESGLVKSIRALVDDLRATTNMNIRFTHDSDADILEYGKQVSLFRVIQEQLKNIVTHSQARTVDILLQRKEDEIFLLIRDDGKGFNIKQSSKGIGISNIYKRARYYNGNVTLQSAPGEGCVLELRLPFDYKQGLGH